LFAIQSIEVEIALIASIQFALLTVLEVKVQAQPALRRGIPWKKN
jgi:hypothetical protein